MPTEGDHSSEDAYSSELVGRLFAALRAETAFLCRAPSPRGARLAFRLEEALGWREGCAVVGVDEAGRGPLAGPVVAGAVRLTPGRPILGLNDSKKLTPEARARLFPLILREAEAVGIGLVTERGIDRWNVREATREAMIRAVRALGPAPPVWVLVDGLRIEPFPFPQVAVVGGDAAVPSIAAASIVAKVARDRLMESFHLVFPSYGFDRHKGYPTEEHARAIEEHGRSPIHRRTFHVPVYAERLPFGEGAGGGEGA